MRNRVSVKYFFPDRVDINFKDRLLLGDNFSIIQVSVYCSIFLASLERFIKWWEFFIWIEVMLYLWQDVAFTFFWYQSLIRRGDFRCRFEDIMDFVRNLSGLCNCVWLECSQFQHLLRDWWMRLKEKERASNNVSDAAMSVRKNLQDSLLKVKRFSD